MLNDIVGLLESYAESLTPWARRTAANMLHGVDIADRYAWRTLGESISLQLRYDLASAPIGGAIANMLDEQVTLIKSLPIEAARRVHDLTMEGLLNSTRASAIAQQIMASGEVTKNRATLIARTEVSRTASALTQSRAQYVGSEGYVWETAEDADVRPSHREMQGKFVRWDSPPTLDGMTGHAGCFPRCRCWSRVVVPKLEHDDEPGALPA